MTPEMQKKRDELLKGRYDERELSAGLIFELSIEWIDGFSAAFDLMQEKAKVLVEALRFYADDAQYNANDIVDGIEVLEISCDQGERAREALKGWE